MEWDFSSDYYRLLYVDALYCREVDLDEDSTLQRLVCEETATAQQKLKSQIRKSKIFV